MKRNLVIIATVLALLPLLAFGAVFLADKAHGYGHYVISFWVYRPLAEMGIDIYEKKIGRMYGNGQGVPKDYKEAVKWYRNPAENGDAQAQAFLGLMYFTSSIGTPDFKQSFKWFFRAANAGNRWAQFMIATGYAEGRGVTPDRVQSYKWYSIYFDDRFPKGFLGKIDEKFGVEYTPAQIAEARVLARVWNEEFLKKQ